MDSDESAGVDGSGRQVLGGRGGSEGQEESQCGAKPTHQEVTRAISEVNQLCVQPTDLSFRQRLNVLVRDLDGATASFVEARGVAAADSVREVVVFSHHGLDL